MCLEKLQRFIQGLWGEPCVSSLGQGALRSTRESVELSPQSTSHFLLREDAVSRSPCEDQRQDAAHTLAEVGLLPPRSFFSGHQISPWLSLTLVLSSEPQATTQPRFRGLRRLEGQMPTQLTGRAAWPSPCLPWPTRRSPSPG